MTDLARLTADARNRALRTFLQALSVDVGVAVALLLLPVFTSADSWGDFQWQVLGFLLFKTIGVSVLSFVMRRYLDKTGATPVPPSDTLPGVPA